MNAGFTPQELCTRPLELLLSKRRANFSAPQIRQYHNDERMHQCKLCTNSKAAANEHPSVLSKGDSEEQSTPSREAFLDLCH